LLLVAKGDDDDSAKGVDDEMVSMMPVALLVVTGVWFVL